MPEQPSTNRAGRRSTNRPTDPFAKPDPEQFVNDSDTDSEDESAGMVVEGEVAESHVIDFPGRAAGPPDEPDPADADADAGGGAGRPGPALALRRATSATGRHTVRAVNAVGTVITHPHTTRSTKLVGRNLWYPVAGTSVVVKRWRDAHGANRYERMMRQAELTGDREMLLEWESRDVSEKQRRHDRVMDWVRSPIDLARAIAVAIAAFTALLLGLGIVLAIADSDVREVVGPILGVISAIRFTAWFLTVYGATLLLAATGGAVAWLWHVGRSYTEPPVWMAPTEASGDREVIPDERAILAALRNLNLAVLNKKFKEGWQPRWTMMTGKDGKGYRTQLELPAGVTVEMINKQKSVLAHNLVRLPVEVWPTEPKNLPGVLDLWVADQGLLTEAVEPYPLLEAGTCDYFKGVPAGVDQRGELVTGKLMAANYAIAGTMGSGKTSLVIELLCGAMLDPIVDIEVYVMAFNVDYDPMKPRLSVLVKGDEDEQVVAAMNALRNLREEVTERGKLLAEKGGEETKLTRALAEADPRMRPKVVVFDECQELFRHEKHGAAAKELAIKVMMKARKCGITLLFVTPAPSADSLPRDLAKTVSHRVCFAIGDHQGNDAILGTGSHKRGITAVDLVPGEDVGTAMASGFSTRPGLLRTHYIRKDKQVDQITPVVERALETWTRPAGQAEQSDQAGSGRDLLDDVWRALRGQDRVKATDVAARLREIAPDWEPYDGLTAEGLAELLDEAGMPVKRVKGTLTVRIGNVGAALAERAEELDPDHDGDDPIDLDEPPGVNRIA
jgi:S-DNA-T family DNA segregation ATPase FtsK/SpoIIIE